MQLRRSFGQGALLLAALMISAAAQAISTQPLSGLLTFPSYRFPAEVVAHTQTTLSSELNARLLSLKVRPGEPVKAGQPLAALDCGDTQDALALNASLQQESQAQLKLAKLQLQRFKNLEKQQYTATSQIDESQTQVQSIQAHLNGLRIQQRQAERAVDRCDIRAPFTGVVTELLAGEGQWLGVGVPLLHLVRTDLSEIWVQLPIDLADAMAQQSAVWQVNGQADQTVKWLRSSAVLPSNQRMVSVWFQAPESALIGSAGNLVVKAQKGHLPAQWVVMRAGQLGVFVVEAGQAQFRVLPEAQAGRSVPIPQAWSLSLPVVTEGQHRLQSGEAVP